jgi:hypothetical protein
MAASRRSDPWLILLLLTSLGACTTASPTAEPRPTQESVAEDSETESPTVKRVEVPQFLGRRIGPARQLAERNDLRLVVDGRRQSTRPRNTVLAQTPAPGANRQPGAVVRVILAQPKPPNGDGDGDNCQGYSPCIPPGPDVDCEGGSGDGPRYVSGPVAVTGSDPYGLDGDGDGQGCE